MSVPDASGGYEISRDASVPRGFVANVLDRSAGEWQATLRNQNPMFRHHQALMNGDLAGVFCVDV